MDDRVPAIDGPNLKELLEVKVIVVRLDNRIAAEYHDPATVSEDCEN